MTYLLLVVITVLVAAAIALQTRIRALKAAEALALIVGFNEHTAERIREAAKAYDVHPCIAYEPIPNWGVVAMWVNSWLFTCAARGYIAIATGRQMAPALVSIQDEIVANHADLLRLLLSLMWEKVGNVFVHSNRYFYGAAACWKYRNEVMLLQSMAQMVRASEFKMLEEHI